MAVAKIEKSQSNKTSFSDKDINSGTKEEISLLNSVQILLRVHGIERSHGSIRDLADISDGIFDFKFRISSTLIDLKSEPCK